MSEKTSEHYFSLSEAQISILESYHRRLLRFLLYQLDDEFQFKPVPEANWTGLGCFMIDFLMRSDSRAFAMIAQAMLHAMLRGDSNMNPFVASAMARSGISKGRIFEEVLDAMRGKEKLEGPIRFGSKILGKGEALATLWNLEILRISGRISDHSSLVEPALAYLIEKVEDVVLESPVSAARLMTTMLDLKPEGGEAVARRCMESIIARQGDGGRWDDSPLGLAVDGEVAGALMEAAPVLGRDAAAAAEKWCVAAFGLDFEGKELPEWPAFFEESRKEDRPDFWMEGWIHAAVAATRCLNDVRPDHNPSAYLLALAVPQDNILVRAQEMLRLAGPYMPPFEEVKTRASYLDAFWGRSAPYDKSVYVMSSTIPSEKRSEVVKAIKDALSKHGLAVRELAEGGMPLLQDPWENAALYMTGCKYGLALFDRLPADDGGVPEGPGPAPEILYQVGFMRGQGSPVLVIWDEVTLEEGGKDIPGVQVPVQGIQPLSFDSNEEGYARLREGVEKWAASLAEDGNDSAGK